MDNALDIEIDELKKIIMSAPLNQISEDEIAKIDNMLETIIEYDAKLQKIKVSRTAFWLYVFKRINGHTSDKKFFGSKDLKYEDHLEVISVELFALSYQVHALEIKYLDYWEIDSYNKDIILNDHVIRFAKYVLLALYLIYSNEHSCSYELIFKILTKLQIIAKYNVSTRYAKNQNNNINNIKLAHNIQVMFYRIAFDVTHNFLQTNIQFENGYKVIVSKEDLEKLTFLAGESHLLAVKELLAKRKKEIKPCATTNYRRNCYLTNVRFMQNGSDLPKKRNEICIDNNYLKLYYLDRSQQLQLLCLDSDIQDHSSLKALFKRINHLTTTAKLKEITKFISAHKKWIKKFDLKVTYKIYDTYLEYLSQSYTNPVHHKNFKEKMSIIKNDLIQHVGVVAPNGRSISVVLNL